MRLIVERLHRNPGSIRDEKLIISGHAPDADPPLIAVTAAVKSKPELRRRFKFPFSYELFPVLTEPAHRQATRVALRGPAEQQRGNE